MTDSTVRQPRTGSAGDAGASLDTLSVLWERAVEWLPNLVIGIVVFVAFVFVGRVAQRVILAIARRADLDESLASLLSRLASSSLYVLGLLVVTVIVVPTFQPGDLIAGLGITSVAIGFAFKDILQNFFAGILILWRRPFRVGDQIRTGEFEGTVEEINIRSTRLETFDGERVVVPNGDVYTRAIVVKTAYRSRRVRFTVGIGYPYSIEQAKEVVHRVLGATDGVLDDPGPWVYVTELAPSSVNLTVYFWAEPTQANVLRVGDRVAEGIKTALDEARIDMPYPHTVVLFHDATGSRQGDIVRPEDAVRDRHEAGARGRSGA